MRLYTVDEARALLPEVIPVLTVLRDAYVALRRLQASFAAEARGATADGNLLANAWAEDGGEDQAEGLNRALRAAARRLDAWDIELKDAEKGLIDFRNERDGEVVYLCYMLGETGISYWHGLGDGFA